MKTNLPIRILFLCCAIAVQAVASAQCLTGTYTVTSSSNTNANFNVNSGQTLIITSGTFTGTVGLNGGTICIASGAVFTPSSFNINGSGGTINNYGRAIFNGLNLSSGFVVNNHDSMSITGNLNWNGTASFNNAQYARVGFTQPFDLKQSSTFTNNGTIWSKGNFTTESGTTFNNNSRLQITGQFNPSGFVNNWGIVIASDFININNGNKTINYCRFVSQLGFNNNDPDTENKGLIWVTKVPTGSDNFVWQNNAALNNSGYIRAISFINNNTINNTGGYIYVQGNASGTYSKNQGTITGGTVGDISNASAYTLDVQIGVMSGVNYANVSAYDTTSDQYVAMCSSSYASYKVSGYVWKDDGTSNGVKDGTEAFYTSGNLYAILVNSANTVLASAAVSTTDGSYSITGVPPSTTNLKVIIAETAGTVGGAAPPTSAPTGYVITGENNNGTAEYPGNGSISLPSTTADLTNRRFGVKVLITYINVSGTVWKDVNNNAVNNSESAYTGGGLYAVLTNGNTVVQSVSVSTTDGSYLLTSLPSNTTGYKVVLSVTAPAVGDTLSAATAPTGYYITGENNNGIAELPGDGIILLPSSAVALTNRNFGIQQPPVAEVKSYAMDAGSSAVSVASIISTANAAITYKGKIAMSGNASNGSTPGALTGSDPDGSIITLVIDPTLYSGTKNGIGDATAFILTYDGVQLHTGGCKGSDVGKGLCSYYNETSGYWEIPAYDAAKLSILIQNGVNQLGFSYAWKDQAAQTGAFKTYSVSFGTVLPLHLLSFEAKGAANDKVSLTWKTAEEVNTTRFEIEHHTGNERFKKVGITSALGLGSGTYTFTHEAQTGSNYYRLKMIDIDGKFTYSPTRLVKLSTASETLTVSPNPVVGKTIKVRWTGALTDKAVLSIIDGNGRVVYSAMVTSPQQAISAQGWASGTYEAVIHTAIGKMQSVKIVLP